MPTAATAASAATAVYFFPLLGAFVADAALGKYQTILSFSLVYCLGHLALAPLGAQRDVK